MVLMALRGVYNSPFNLDDPVCLECPAKTDVYFDVAKLTQVYN